MADELRMTLDPDAEILRMGAFDPGPAGISLVSFERWSVVGCDVAAPRLVAIEIPVERAVDAFYFVEGIVGTEAAQQMGSAHASVVVGDADGNARSLLARIALLQTFTGDLLAPLATAEQIVIAQRLDAQLGLGEWIAQRALSVVEPLTAMIVPIVAQKPAVRDAIATLARAVGVVCEQHGDPRGVLLRRVISDAVPPAGLALDDDEVDRRLARLERDLLDPGPDVHDGAGALTAASVRAAPGEWSRVVHATTVPIVSGMLTRGEHDVVEVTWDRESTEFAARLTGDVGVDRGQSTRWCRVWLLPERELLAMAPVSSEDLATLAIDGRHDPSDLRVELTDSPLEGWPSERRTAIGQAVQHAGHACAAVRQGRTHDALDEWDLAHDAYRALGDDDRAALAAEGAGAAAAALARADDAQMYRDLADGYSRTWSVDRVVAPGEATVTDQISASLLTHEE